MEGFPGRVVAPAGMGRFTFSQPCRRRRRARVSRRRPCSALGTPRMASALGTPLMVAPSEGADVEGEPWPAAAARSRSSFALRSAMGTFGARRPRRRRRRLRPCARPRRKDAALRRSVRRESARGRRRRRGRGRARSAIPVRGGFFGPSLKVSLSPPAAPRQARARRVAPRSRPRRATANSACERRTSPRPSGRATRDRR